MIDDCDIKQRWNRVEALIDRWLAERQSLIVQFCGVIGVREAPAQGLPARYSRLMQFCQLLIDYLSSGHFEVYYQLLCEAEAFADGSAESARIIFPRVHETTASLLKFNDKYTELGEISDPTQLAKDLSELGEVLAERFELEDRMIVDMHRAHSEVA